MLNITTRGLRSLRSASISETRYQHRTSTLTFEPAAVVSRAPSAFSAARLSIVAPGTTW